MKYVSQLMSNSENYVNLSIFFKFQTEYVLPLLWLLEFESILMNEK